MANSAQTGIGQVVALWRYPVKSMMGEELNVADITDRGLLGDRMYGLVDRADRKVAPPRIRGSGQTCSTTAPPR